MQMDTTIPPRYRRDLISRHWFVWETKKRRLRFFKAAVSNRHIGVSIGLLHDGFFSFAVVRQLDNRLFLFLRIIIKSKCHRNVRAALIFDRKTS